MQSAVIFLIILGTVPLIFAQVKNPTAPRQTNLQQQTPRLTNLEQLLRQMNIQPAPHQTNLQQALRQTNLQQAPRQTNLQQAPLQTNLQQAPRQINLQQTPTMTSLHKAARPGGINHLARILARQRNPFGVAPQILNELESLGEMPCGRGRVHFMRIFNALRTPFSPAGRIIQGYLDSQSCGSTSASSLQKLFSCAEYMLCTCQAVFGDGGNWTPHVPRVTHCGPNPSNSLNPYYQDQMLCVCPNSGLTPKLQAIKMGLLSTTGVGGLAGLGGAGPGGTVGFGAAGGLGGLGGAGGAGGLGAAGGLGGLGGAGGAGGFGAAGGLGGLGALGAFKKK